MWPYSILVSLCSVDMGLRGIMRNGENNIIRDFKIYIVHLGYVAKLRKLN
jgi:hypothetical protein